MTKDLWIRDHQDQVIHVQAKSLSWFPLATRLTALMMSGLVLGALMFTASL